MRRNLKRIVYGAFFGLILVLPLLSRNEYVLFVMNKALLNIIVASGLVFLTGFAGQISLGQVGFVAIGAYTSGLVTTRLGMPIPIGIVAGIALSVIVGLVVAIPSFKLKAFFLSLVTIAFGQIIYLLLVNLTAVTGGSQGLFNIPPMKLSGTPFTNTLYYYLFLVLVALVILLMYRLKYSYIGRQMFAVNDDDVAAEACAINSRKTKVFAFGLSAGLAGLSGALTAHMVGFLTPDPFTFFDSANFVAMAVVGGLRQLSGGVVGGFALTWLPELLRLKISGFENYYLLVNSVIVLLVLVFLPSGLGASLSKGLSRLWGEKQGAVTLHNSKSKEGE
jgi:branched-chain amino acid transport system permease protein